ncbi:MAG: 4-alpha-glucanotransferase [Alphaproteobacteria bacterium]
MSRLDALRRVAGLLGIATNHVDAFGNRHEAAEETLSRLIAAFGLPADPKQAAAALDAERDAAPFGLAPVHIVDPDDPGPVLSLPRPPQGDVEWHIRLEDGSEHRGRGEGAALRLPGGLPLGYHRLAVMAGSARAEIDLIVAPRSCHLPEGLRAGARSWGLTAQVYGLRSFRDWGIGDFTGLEGLCRRAGALGAAVIGVNPLHALFTAEPRHFSPYSPSSRLWLNYLYIDVTAVPGFAEDKAAQALVQASALAAARSAELVDYAAVAAVKRPVLEALFERFYRTEMASGSMLAEDFQNFREAGGRSLVDFAVFEALHEHFLRQSSEFSWHSWPAAMRDPRSAEIAEFARAHARRVMFFQFLQWIADRQLGRAAASGRGAGLGIGLYRDLAIGANPHGADAWADNELVVSGASIGAPPDPLSRSGQNWGLAPLNPLVLRRRGFTPLIAALRANMRHAGVLRIDHVMGLRRLYWVPSGGKATSGAYVDYPFEEVLRLLALESRRHRCAVIGEDLGTVPPGFRETMQTANVLSYRIFAFERRDDGGFTPPGEYPALAAASAATHDLATVKGFWLGRDIEWRRRLGTYPDKQAELAEAEDRCRDRRLLLEALAREGLLARERFGRYLSEDGEPGYDRELGEAILVYLARSRARLMLVQIEDVAGESEQANLPGTTDSHPNWRRRLDWELDELLAGPAMARIAALVTEARRYSAADQQASRQNR